VIPAKRARSMYFAVVGKKLPPFMSALMSDYWKPRITSTSRCLLQVTHSPVPRNHDCIHHDDILDFEHYNREIKQCLLGATHPLLVDSQ
jgi:hypothetical protein